MPNKKKVEKKEKQKKIQREVCDDPDHPEFNGLPCLCASCRPVNYCIPDEGGCSLCLGPVIECDGPDEDKEPEKEED